MSKYYIGLDLKEDAVGWAVTDESYNLFKVNGKKTWGVRSFSKADLSENRRLFRSSRRNLKRKKFRTDFLRELMKEEIEKVDKDFFRRLDESKFYLEDKTVNCESIIFENKKLEKEYYKKFTTIFHLINFLATDKQLDDIDIRHLFIVLNYFMKNRGHFYLKGKDFNVSDNLHNSLYELLESIQLNCDLSLNVCDSVVDSYLETLTDNSISNKIKLENITSAQEKIYKKPLENIFKLVLGNIGNLKFIFPKEDIEEDYLKIEFDDKFDEKKESFKLYFKERFDLIIKAKNLHDAILLDSILKGSKTISEAKIKEYNKHKEDLAKLKLVLRNHDKKYNLVNTDKLYYEVLKKDEEKFPNYVSYIGKSYYGKKAKKEDFYEFLLKTLNKVDNSKEKEEIINDIAANNFLITPKSKENAIIPNQLVVAELKQVLNNTSSKFDFLNKVDEKYNISNKDKIIQMASFIIPYYVGPLNTAHNIDDKNGYSWVVRSNEKVYPWNFNEVINIPETAEKFIRNMTKKCTYINEEDVLPRNSILYSEFALLNELNTIKYNNIRIDVSTRNEIIDKFFVKGNGSLTEKKLLKFLFEKGLCSKDTAITGINGKVSCDIKSYRDMISIFGNKFNHQMAEDLICWITIFGEEKDVAKRKILNSKYAKAITDEQLEKLLKLNYFDWGKLSQKLLNGITNKYNETIIDVLRKENMNFIEIITLYPEFLEEVDNGMNKITSINYELVDNLFISPSAKRSLWQSIKIIEDIKRNMGHSPSKIFIKTSIKSTNEEKFSNKKKKVEKLFKSAKIDKDLKTLFKETDANMFRRKRVFLYFLQKGRCLYTGEAIDFNELFSDKYSIDHIVPKCFKNDNSNDNIALVKTDINKEKTNSYPLPKDIQDNMKLFWIELKNDSLLSDIKYNKLIREEEFTEEELKNFLNVQVYETSKNKINMSNLLSKIYPNTNVSLVKSSNVDAFRNGENRKELLKTYNDIYYRVENLNCFDTAKDAFLSIIVGNVYNHKFSNFAIFKNDSLQSLNNVFSFDIIDDDSGKYIWKTDMFEIINKYMCCHDFLISKKSFEKKGELANATISKAKDVAKSTERFLPIKSKDKRLCNVNRYGGHSHISNTYFSAYEIMQDDGMKKTYIIPMPLYIVKTARKKEISDYCLEYIKSKDKKVGNIVSINCIYEKIKIDQLIRYNNAYFYFGGKTGAYFILKSANEVFFDKDTEFLLCRILKYLELAKNNIINAEEPFKIKDDTYLSDDILNSLFETILEKRYVGRCSFKMIDKLNEIEKNKSLFYSLSIFEKASILQEMICILNEKNRLKYEGLKKIGVKNSNGIKVNFNISDAKEFIVYENSPTRLYSKQISII